MLAGTPEVPIFTTNATAADDPGVAALKAHLTQAAAALPARAGGLHSPHT